MKPRLIVVYFALAAAAATAQTRSEACDSASVDQLKAAYLACDRLMTHQRADTGTVLWCTAVGEQLKQRGFDGDFDRLIAWWQRERAAPQAQAPVMLPSCSAGTATAKAAS